MQKIQYFCDRCEKEVSNYDFLHAIQVGNRKLPNLSGTEVFEVCDTCRGRILEVLKGELVKGEK